MFLVRGTLLDPLFQESNFVGLERFFVRFGRGHDVVGVGADDALDDVGGIGVAFEDGGLTAFAGEEGEFFAIEAERALFGLAGGGIWPVALVAILRKDGLDVIVEVYDVGKFCTRESSGRKEGEKENAAH